MKQTIFGSFMTMFLPNWDKIKKIYNEFSLASDSSEAKENPVVGKLAWSNPDTVLWLEADLTNEQGDYEGSAEQYGIDKNGNLVWEYYSHCSCNWYSDYEGTFKQFIIDGGEVPNRFKDIEDKLQKILTEINHSTLDDKTSKPEKKMKKKDIKENLIIEIKLKSLDQYMKEEFDKILDKNLTRDEKKRLLDYLDEKSKENGDQES